MFSDMQNQTLGAAFAISGAITQNLAPGIRLIAVTDREEDERLSSVKTFADQGVQDMDMVGWFGWRTPAGTPVETVQRLSAQAAQMQKSERFLALQRALILKPVNMTPAEVSTRMKSETATYERLIQAYGIPKMA